MSGWLPPLSRVNFKAISSGNTRAPEKFRFPSPSVQGVSPRRREQRTELTAKKFTQLITGYKIQNIMEENIPTNPELAERHGANSPLAQTADQQQFNFKHRIGGGGGGGGA